MPSQSSDTKAYFYVHDIASTAISNKEVFGFCTRSNLDMGSIPAEIHAHITNNPHQKMEVVVLQCYECDYFGNVRQDEKHLVTVIGEKYSHFVQDDVHGDVKLSRATADAYNFDTKAYHQSLYRTESFYSEHESNKRVLELLKKKQLVYGNAHKFLNEFSFKLYEGFDDRDFKGRLILKPNNGYNTRFMSKETFIQSETVIFGNAKSIKVVNDSHINEYSYQHKTLSFDIETVLIDEHGEKIDDQITQISLVYQEGNTLFRTIGLTIGDAITDTSFYDYNYMSKCFSNEVLPTVEVYSCKNQSQLIEKFIEIYRDVKPDFIAGYNVIAFDLPVLLKTAFKFNIDLYDELTAINGFEIDKFIIKQTLQASTLRKHDTTISTLEDNKEFNLNYGLFHGALINDLYRFHKGEKLNELANTVLGFGKDDVDYTEIPQLFYSPQISDKSKLVKYNIIDSLLVAALINEKYFMSYKFFIITSYKNKTPISEFFNQQKTPMLIPLFYGAFKRNNMLQEMKIKPKKEANKLITYEIVQYFLYNQRTVIPKSKELIQKFKSGTIKTKTVKKHMNLNEEFSDLNSIDFNKGIEVLVRQLANAEQKSTKHGKSYYTLTHLMLYLRFLTEPTKINFDLDTFIRDYFKANNKGRYAPVCISKRRKIKKGNDFLINEEKRLTASLISFIEYLTSITITSSHTLELLYDNYFENELVETTFQDSIRDFAKSLNSNDVGKLGNNFLHFIIQVRRSLEGKRFTDKQTYETFCDVLYSKIGDHLLFDFYTPSKYDGAYVCLPRPGVEFERPLACLDFSAMYPKLGIGYNVGPETIVSQKSIIQNGLKEKEDYVKINLNAISDHKDIDITKLTTVEADLDYICFLTTKHVSSMYREIWHELLETRLQFKRLIGTFADPNENKLVEEKSNMCKIVANSVYGVFPFLGQWKISASITSLGRQNIQKVGWYCEKNYNAKIVYGDTDSVMFHLNLTTEELCEIYEDNTLLQRGWIRPVDCEHIDTFANDRYKQGCEITAMISRQIAHKLNNMHVDNPSEAIYYPPSNLEHEKVMLPFIIYAQKHYFGKIMDTNCDNAYIIRGLKSRTRDCLPMTFDIQQLMFDDLLQQYPSTFKPFHKANETIKSIKDDSIDLTKIAFNKKITVSASHLQSTKADAGVDLFRRMLARGEITNTGGLDKITIKVVKVINFESKSKVRYESLVYLKSLQKQKNQLNIDKIGIAKQILGEVISIMKVILAPKTFDYFERLLILETSDGIDSLEFKNFISTDDIATPDQVTQCSNKKGLLNKTLFGYYTTEAQTSCLKRKNLGSDIENSPKKMRQSTLSYFLTKKT